MGVVVVGVGWLSLLNSRVWSAPVKPDLRGIKPVSRDGVVWAVWDIVSHQPPLEWIVQASADSLFTKIVSSSGWIQPKVGSFLLPVPRGEVFVRVGSREAGAQKIAWSATKRSDQQDNVYHQDITEIANQYGQSKSRLINPAYKRPVVFIHGLGGRPEDWQDQARGRDYIQLLRDHGYPAGFIRAYHYADYNFDGAYDAFGDLWGIWRDLPSLIKQLQKLDRQNGGKGKVDIVGFSLGGLVGRTYLKNLAANPGVGKLITIATPHLGANWLSPWQGLQKKPFGLELQKAIAVLVKEFYPNQARPLDLEGQALSQLVPNSTFFHWLNNEAPPGQVEYHLLYGDLRVKFSQDLFHLKFVSEEYSLGDLVVGTSSASTLPDYEPELYPYRSSHHWSIKPIKKGIGWAYQLEVDLPELRYWHSSLPGQPEVKKMVLKILTQ